MSESEHSSADEWADVFLQRISVPFEYPVYFTRRVFDASSALLADAMNRAGENRVHRAAVFVDAGAAAAHPGLAGQIKEYFHARQGQLELAAAPEILPGGEACKVGWGPVRDIMWTIGNLHLDRQSFVIAVGGGAMLDMVGFATSIVHRGLRLIRVPTTTLAQNDAGIGVKNGMNEHGQKNFVGTFAPPWAVLNDFAFLATLSQRDWIGGAAEAFKVALIRDGAFFDWLCSNAAALRRREAEPMEQLIRRCAVLHLEHTRDSGDPFELGSARPLDFGHWVAHELEKLSAYAIGHGQAVSIGVAMDSFIAMRLGLIAAGELDRIVAALLACGLPVWCEQLSQRKADGELAVLDGLAAFREHLGGTLCVTLPKGIGDRVEVHHVGADIVEQAAEHLRQAQRSAE